MVATAKTQSAGGDIQLADVHRFSVDRYNQMISPKLDRKIFTPGQRLPLVIEQKTLAEIAVDDLLPLS